MTAMARRIGFLGAVLVTLGTVGCQGKARTHEWALMEADVAFPEITGRERPVRRAGEPAEVLEIRRGGGQTVLVACRVAEDVPSDRPYWHRNLAYVIAIPSPLSTGSYDVTPENGRFLENAAWIPARRPYVGLEGRIRVLSFNSRGAVVDCSVRNVITRTGDPVYPLRGIHTFEFATVDEGVLNGCAIRLDGAPAPAPEVQ